MSESAYRNHPAVNYSSLKTLVNGTPRDYKHALANPLVPTSAMNIGTLVHAIFLERKPFPSLAVVPPQDAPKRPTSVQRNTKKPSTETLDAIAFWDAFNAQSAGKIVLNWEEKQQVENAVESLMQSEWLAGFMQDAQVEKPYFGLVEEVEVKGLVDGISSDSSLIVDLKTLSLEIDPSSFGRMVGQRHLDLQSALYSDLVSLSLDSGLRPNFVWVAQQVVEPFNLAIYSAGDTNYFSGKSKLTHCLTKLKNCRTSGTWPSFPDGPISLELPKWAQFDQQTNLASND